MLESGGGGGGGGAGKKISWRFNGIMVDIGNTYFLVGVTQRALFIYWNMFLYIESPFQLRPRNLTITVKIASEKPE